MESDLSASFAALEILLISPQDFVAFQDNCYQVPGITSNSITKLTESAERLSPLSIINFIQLHFSEMTESFSLMWLSL